MVAKATTRKSYIGKVLNYFNEVEVAHVKIESGEIKIDDSLLIIGDTTGVLEIKLENMYVNDKEESAAKKGEEITFKIPSIVRRNDKVYLIQQIK